MYEQNESRHMKKVVEHESLTWTKLELYRCLKGLVSLPGF